MKNSTIKYKNFLKENNVIPYLIIGFSVYILATLLTVRLKGENVEKSVNIYENEEYYRSLEIISGLSDVKGEGIIITIEDGENAKENSVRTDSIVHDSDLLSIVNELRASSAEAISINDERITNLTSIRCVGPVVQINFKPFASPFVIKVIGNKRQLNSALSIKNGVLDILKNAGIKVEIEEKNDIEVYKYDSEISLKYAK